MLNLIIMQPLNRSKNPLGNSLQTQLSKFRADNLTVLVLIVAITWVLGCGSGGGSNSESSNQVIEKLVENADFPVGLAPVSDGRIFYTELRTGKIRVIREGVLLPPPVSTIPVPTDGNEGLLGIVADPDFESNHFLYVYHTVADGSRNRVIRLTEKSSTAGSEKVLLDGIPTGGHDGGRLVFGRDGLLYISTGDADTPPLSQDLTSLAGKILRIKRDGSIPSDNPIPGSPIFAWGFRNPFGLTVDTGTGSIVVSDNGPSCDDEVNVVVKGGNYGWSESQPCGDNTPGFVMPLRRFENVISPTGLKVYRGALFPEFNGQILLGDFLQGKLRRLSLESGNDVGEIIDGEFGPIIDVAVDSAGQLLVATPDTILRISR